MIIKKQNTKKRKSLLTIPSLSGGNIRKNKLRETRSKHIKSRKLKTRKYRLRKSLHLPDNVVYVIQEA